jgi:hypothetical protein
MYKSVFRSPDYINDGLDSGSSRRSFLKTTAAVAVIAGSDLFGLVNEGFATERVSVGEVPWYQRVTRWGQTNITEKDPAHYDIEWWRSHWKRTHTQGVIINAGGIVAYYPSKVPLHHQAQYLAGRDLFGDLCQAAHEDGLAVFARMDSNRAHDEFYNAHPDWFARDSAGNPYKAGELFITCINGPYYSEHIPEIIGEIAKFYHPEGFTDNSWSGLGRDTICYCGYCRKSFQEKTGNEIPQKADWNDKIYHQWIRWNYGRRLEIWELNNRISKAAGGLHCIWSGMNSGSVRQQSESFRDLKEICLRADIIMLDSQARNDAGGFQQNSDTGKLIHGLLGWNKLVPESMAMYQAGRPTFRFASKPVPEARMWMIEGIAGGIQPWWHYVGASHEDRRIYHTPLPVFEWHMSHEEFLIDRKPVATVGVVWSQQNMDFYGRDDAEQKVELPMRGITQALIRSRIPYVPVHADHIDRDGGGLSLLVLPDLGVMTDEQAASIKRFVNRGGGLMATGKSSRFDEWGDSRPDYALGDLFGVHVEQTSKSLAGPPANQYGETYHTYLRLTPELRKKVDGPQTGLEPAVMGARHPVFNGFDETDILSFGGLLEPVKTDPGTEVLLTFIPPFPIYPPETAWMREPVTDIPGLVLNTTTGGSRIAFLPADLDRQYGRYNLPDHGNLLANIIRWTARDNIPLAVECAGLIDCNLYLQPGCMILHLVNLTNSATWRQPEEEFIPVGPVKVWVRIAENFQGKNLQLLVSDQIISHTVENGWIHFTISSITDHEVAVIT